MGKVIDMYQAEVNRIQRLINIHADSLTHADQSEIDLASLDRCIRVLLNISHRVKDARSVLPALTGIMGRVDHAN